MRLFSICESRKDIRLFAGLRSVNDIKSVFDNGMLVSMDLGGVYFADTIEGAYDYRDYHGEDAYAVIEVLSSAGHSGLIDAGQDLSDLSDLHPELAKSLQSTLDASDYESEIEQYADYVKGGFRKPSKVFSALAQATRARKSRSGDMQIIHNVGFTGRPRIVGIYIVGSDPEKIIKKVYDKGEASYDVGYTL